MSAHAKQVLIATPSDLLEASLKSALVECRFSVTTAASANVIVTGETSADVVFLDDRLLDELTVEIILAYINCPLILLSASCDALYVWQMVQAGASGYLYLQDRLLPRLRLTVEDVCSGGLYLSPSAQIALATIRHYREQHLTAYQRDVMRLMVKHWTAPRIARALGRKTDAIYQVQRYLRQVFDVQTNSELIQRAQSLNLIPQLQNGESAVCSVGSMKSRE